MIRLFLPPDKLSSEQIKITGEQARHLSLVLKAKSGDPLVIFDGLGYRYTCRILQSHKKEVIVEHIKKEPCPSGPDVSITLAQGIPKGEKMDYIIQKATELGVKKIVPVITERSQVRHTQKAGRWRKIAFSASQQSGRDKIPEVVEPLILEKFLNTLPQVSAKEGTLRLIFSESQEERNMKKVLSRFKGLHSVMLLIGPEGGFSQEEIILSVEQGFIDVSLGPRILRAETAPVTAISIIQYELGDIG